MTIRFERPRVALDFRALADSLPAKVDGVGEADAVPRVPNALFSDVLRAHINRAVQSGRIRRGLPAGEPYDLEADLPDWVRE